MVLVNLSTAFEHIPCDLILSKILEYSLNFEGEERKKI